MIHVTGPTGRRGVRPAARRRGRRAPLGDAGSGGRVRQPYAVGPARCVDGAGGAYKVFTPYSRPGAQHGWLAREVRRGDRPRPPWRPSVGRRCPAAPPPADLAEPGEAAAGAGLLAGSGRRRRLRRRPRPPRRSTRRAGCLPYLKFGLRAPAPAARRPRRRERARHVRAELAWRDFYADVLCTSGRHRVGGPGTRMAAIEVADRGAVRGVGGRPHRLPDRRRRHAPARRRGLDAQPGADDLGQLPRQGPPPRLEAGGARCFLEHLVDGDLASNNHGWQWVAGTRHRRRPRTSGSSTRTAQGRGFDPDGDYVRRWVPELAEVPTGTRGAAPDGPPDGYPAPIVDHANERKEALPGTG